MNNNIILKMEPLNLLEWLANEYLIQLPEAIVTVEDMNNAAKLLLRLSNSYSYLCVLYTEAKLATRRLKKDKNKTEYEEMLDRKDVIENIKESVKQQYAAISRSVTVKIENNKELQMNTTGYIQ